MTVSRSDVSNANLLQRGPYVGIRKRFFRGQLGTSSATILYAAPAFTGSVANPLALTPGAEVRSLWIGNKDTVARTVSLWIVELGGTVADDRLLLPGVSIPAAQAYQVDDEMYLEASESIRMVSDVASKVSVRITGIEWHLSS